MEEKKEGHSSFVSSLTGFEMKLILNRRTCTAKYNQADRCLVIKNDDGSIVTAEDAVAFLDALGKGVALKEPTKRTIEVAPEEIERRLEGERMKRMVQDVKSKQQKELTELIGVAPEDTVKSDSDIIDSLNEVGNLTLMIDVFQDVGIMEPTDMLNFLSNNREDIEIVSRLKDLTKRFEATYKAYTSNA